VGLDIAGNKPAHNALLYAADDGKAEIGSISSAAWSPTCKRNIALAMVDAPRFQLGSVVWAEIYLNRELVWERRMSRAVVVERPFFSPSRRRAALKISRRRCPACRRRSRSRWPTGPGSIPAPSRRS
jgi:aminomethyltransferase